MMTSPNSSSSFDYNPTDLSSVLRTLSSLTTPNTTTTTTDNNNNNLNIQNQNQKRTEEKKNIQEEESYEPTDTIPISVNANATTPKDISQNKDNINPSNITTWPTALKYVVQITAKNEAIQYRIRRLIQSQHDHEKQWWSGREALIKRQESRAERKGELDRVLYVSIILHVYVYIHEEYLSGYEYLLTK